MGDNGEKDMLDALGRVFEDEEPLPKNVTNRLILGGLKMVYATAKEGRLRSRANAIQIRIQWGLLALMGGAMGFKFAGLF
jgi:hypothetical protein